MKLSELVNFYNQLNTLSTANAQNSAKSDIGKIFYLINSQNTQFQNFKTSLENSSNELQHCFETFDLTLEELKKDVKSQIEFLEKGWFQESYRLYEEEMIYESNEYILNRRPELNKDTEIFYTSRLKKHSNWKYPGLIFRPGLESFIQEMVSNDPLYLLDQNHDLLVPSMKQFPEKYQQRLRPYVVNENSDEILLKIPNQQFGLCLVYNFLNFRPFELIKKYLTEFYNKLRPGGILIITFNDCDNHKAVKLVEQHFACYTPGYLVKDLARSLGYEQLLFWNDGGPSSWLELKKPGELDSLRGGQTLGKIISK